MRRCFCLISLAGLTLAGSAPAQGPVAPLDAELRQAQADRSAAEAEVRKLRDAAAHARNEAERLHAAQLTAAQEIEAAEARITAATTQLRVTSAYVDAHRAKLHEQQRPVSALLAGLAVMGRQPPLVALASGATTDELVKVRILLDSTLPVIRARTARISAELAEGERLRAASLAARGEFARSRQELAAKREQFAIVEQAAIRRALVAGSRALTVGDVAISASEDVERMRGSTSASRAAAALATQLAAIEAPARPVGGEGPPLRPAFVYQLPISAPVSEGFAAVNSSGVRSRGLTFATSRGAPVLAPASGVVRFVGPFRDYDGILLLDHGDGWMSLIVNLASPLKAGAKVTLGQPVGSALGPVSVELSQNGRRISPALIAGSSQTLSKGRKGG
jgi:septal ring factor EnvC (AmiA/AmiB activator)